MFHSQLAELFSVNDLNLYLVLVLGQLSHLQLVVVRPAAAVGFLGRVFVGVKQETDAAVITHLHVLHT